MNALILEPLGVCEVITPTSAEGVGCKLNKAKAYNSVVNPNHPPIIQGDDLVIILDVLVPHELRQFIGTVCLFIDYLGDICPDNFILNFLKRNYNIMKRYDGGTFVGNQCSVILKNVDELEAQIHHNLRVSHYYDTVESKFKRYV